MADTFDSNNCEQGHSVAVVVDGAGPACKLLRLARDKVAHRCLLIYIEQRLACVFLDLDIQGSAGLDACRTIRGLPEATDTTIIVLTTPTSVETFDAALLAGADEILFKPVATPTLLAAIETTVEPNRHSPAHLRRRCERLCQQRAQLEAASSASPATSDLRGWRTS